MLGQPAGSSDAVATELGRGVRLHYRPELDGLRAIAVALVVAFHFTAQAYPLRGGFVGVDLFFVLSGFLITRLLLEEAAGRGHVALGQFYLRRAARLLPALALVLVFVAIAARFDSTSASSSTLGIVSSAFYVSNWVRIVGNIQPLEHTWSLAIEEQFYLIWPVVFVVFFRWKGLVGIRFVSLAAVVFAVFETAARSLGGQPSSILYNGTDSHGAIFLALGCLLAGSLPVEPCPERTRIIRSVRLLIVPAVCVLVVITTSVSVNADYYYVGGFLVSGLCLLVLLTASLFVRPIRAVLSVAPLVWIGRISYGVYLWHYVLLRLVPEIFPSVPHKPVALLLTVVFATVSFYLVELPLRRKIRGGDPRAAERAKRPRRRVRVAGGSLS